MSISKDIALDLIHKQWLSFLPISRDNYQKLVDAGKINPLSTDSGTAQKMLAQASPVYVKRDEEEEVFEKKAAKRAEVDPAYSRPFYKYVERENIHLLYEDKYGEEPYKKIRKEDWMPDSITEHHDDFIRWINSMLFDGFQNRVRYEKFELYQRQAYQWLHENNIFESQKTKFERNEFVRGEFMRMEENSLYGLNKYTMLTDAAATDTGGMMPLVCAPHQEIVAYLLDCGYSFFDIKGRQVGLTSVVGAWAQDKIKFKRNYFIKYFAHDDLKTEEIFRDKIKSVFGNSPFWLRTRTNDKGERESIALNDRDNLLLLGKKDEKGTATGHQSKIFVQAPSVYAVNGGGPNTILIDEAALIDVFSPMMKEAIPVMTRVDPKTGRLKQVRQIVAWTTGGVLESIAKGFEREFMALLKRWKESPSRQIIIPLFFDWTAKPGITPEQYDKEREFYYSGEGEDAEKSRIQFHQHYPTTIDDVFLTSHTTLLSIKYISDMLNKCRAVDHDLRPEFGRFEPIYDTSRPLGENSWQPYQIVGATWVPADTFDDPKNFPVKIFLHPERNWMNRYYQGTDPTGSVQTASDMSSTIWDEKNKTIAATVNTMAVDYRQRFLQCALLNLYYTTDFSACPELVEKNVGLSYCDFKSNLGLDGSLVATTQLPDIFRTQNDLYGYGIDNRRGAKNQKIIQNMYSLFHDYGSRVFIDIFWIQLKTFIKKTTKEGNETWGASNKTYFKDDALFSAAFSYICRQVFEGVEPMMMTQEAISADRERAKVTPFSYDKDFNLVYG